MPDEVNIDELLELETDEERAQRLRVGLLGGTTPPTPPSRVLGGGHV